MDANKLRNIVFLFLCFSFLTANSQEILQTKISIFVKNETVEQVLTKITSEYDIAFSYNPEVISNNERINLDIKQSALQDVLKIVLQNSSVELKSISNTIIILPRLSKISYSDKQKYHISGRIINKETQMPIPFVTVFDINKLKSTLTNQEGKFSLEANSKETIIKVSFSKKDYWDTIIFIKPEVYSNYQIGLKPKSPQIDLISKRKIQELPSTNSVNNLKIVKLATTTSTIVQQDNLSGYSENRVAQISFLPNLGTNRRLSSLVNNKFSFNVLAGYSYGVNGVEVGGLLNIAKQNAVGIQFSGFGNIVGKEVKGIQIAGFFNNCTGEVRGVQFAGFSNIVLDTLRGIQVSGFSNIVRGKVKGYQIAGFNNIATTTVDGGQIGGFLNIALDSAGKNQISGFLNYGKFLRGNQISGFGNINIGNAKGTQIAGFGNLNFGNFEGCQIAGFINCAKKINGVQFGFLNIADSVNGASVGIFSIVKHGYHEVELYYSDITFANIAFKTGTKSFYNTLYYGEGLKENIRIWSYGYGIGRSQNLINEKLYLDLDLTSGVLNFGNNFNKYFSLNNTLKTGFSFKIFNSAYVFFNTALNYYVYETAQPISENIIKGNANQLNASKYSTRKWVGYNIGIRL